MRTAHLCKHTDSIHKKPINEMDQITVFATLQKGFTLIEIMVVILIVGITLSFALMSFGDFGEKRRIIISAEQFNNYVKLAQQLAILETATLGVAVNKNGYQILQLSARAQWRPMPSTSIFHAQYFPKGAIIHLESHSSHRGDPAIIINSSGDISVFKLTFGTAKNTSMIAIVSELNGALRSVKSP